MNAQAEPAEDYFGRRTSLFAYKDPSWSSGEQFTFWVPAGDDAQTYLTPTVDEDLKRHYAEITDRIKELVVQHATQPFQVSSASTMSSIVNDAALNWVMHACIMGKTA